MEAANRLRPSNHAGCESFYSKVRKILESNTRYRSKWRLNLNPIIVNRDSVFTFVFAMRNATGSAEVQPVRDSNCDNDA